MDNNPDKIKWMYQDEMNKFAKNTEKKRKHKKKESDMNDIKGRIIVVSTGGLIGGVSAVIIVHLLKTFFS